jgi:hypothetical protein
MFCYVYLVAMADDLDPLAAIRNERSTFAKNERKLSRARRSRDIKNAILKTGRCTCLQTICARRKFRLNIRGIEYNAADAGG